MVFQNLAKVGRVILAGVGLGLLVPIGLLFLAIVLYSTYNHGRAIQALAEGRWISQHIGRGQRRSEIDDILHRRGLDPFDLACTFGGVPGNYEYRKTSSTGRDVCGFIDDRIWKAMAVGSKRSIVFVRIEGESGLMATACETWVDAQIAFGPDDRSTSIVVDPVDTCEGVRRSTRTANPPDR